MDYNPGGELTKRSDPSGVITTYGYDPHGDRTSETINGVTANLGYDSAGHLTQYARLANENVSRNGVRAYQPVQVATYNYNGDGLRISKTLAASTPANPAAQPTTFSFTLDMSGPLPLVLSDGTDSFIYGPNGLPVEQIGPSSAVAYLHQDQLGSTRLLTSEGKVVGTYAYDSFGKTTSITGSVTTPLGFAGQYTDAESGFIYLRARQYDPVTAQFISVDPLAAVTKAPYGYAGNDPLNSIDPSGLASYNFSFDLGPR